MKKSYRIAVIPGEGIGKEVVPQTVKVLRSVAKRYKRSFKFTYCEVGKAAYHRTGNYFPSKIKSICDESDAILFGAVEKEPLLELRKRYSLFANIRPVKGRYMDLVVFRELTGGIYFGKSGYKLVRGVRKGYHTEEYATEEIKRIARLAFRYAKENGKTLTSIDKDNALPYLEWRKTIDEVAKEFPEVQYRHILMDNALAQLYLNPTTFQVVVASNLFGDLFSDLAAVMAGSLGMAPSASLNDKGFGLFEPIHGTAPDIAGKGISNPCGSILSAAMMLKNFGMDEESKEMELAVLKVTRKYATPDLSGKGKKTVTTKELGNLIADEVLK